MRRFLFRFSPFLINARGKGPDSWYKFFSELLNSFYADASLQYMQSQSG
jgi:hypothetical protein